MLATSGKRWLTAAFVFIASVSIDFVYLYQRAQETASVNIPAYAALPSPNGFDLYMRAGRELKPVNSPLSPPGNGQLVTQGTFLLNSPKPRRTWIASNTSSWALLAQARTLPTRLPNLRATDLPESYWVPLRELARAQYIRAQDCQSVGKWGQSSALGLDIIEMGRNLEHGASLINALTSMAIEAVAFPSFDDLPAHLNTSEARGAARRLENVINTAQPYSDVLREEKWRAATALNRTGTLSNIRHATFSESFFVPRVKSVPAAITTLDMLISQADKPKAAQNIVSPDNEFTEAFPGMFADVANTLHSNARRSAQERLLLLRLALRAYFLQHGIYPTQLADLVPTYIQKVPVDPYGKGESLRYQPSGYSYFLWSIGPDGVDDHATPIPPFKGRTRAIALPSSKGDIVAQP